MIPIKNAPPFPPSFLFQKAIFNLGHFSELVFSTILQTFEVSRLSEEWAVAWADTGDGAGQAPKTASQLQAGHQDTPAMNLTVLHSLAHTSYLNVVKSTK